MMIRFRHPKDFGGLGNQMLWYYRVRKYCEDNLIDFEMDRWAGEDIFDSVSHPVTGLKPDLEWDNSTINTIIERAIAARYFKLKPQFQSKSFPLVLHIRRGDYVEANSFPLIGIESYRRGCHHNGIEWNPVVVTDDVPFQFWKPDICERRLSHGIDFGIMVNAATLFIGNSTFSWWAGILSKGEVFEPRHLSETGKTATCLFRKLA